jgi:HEAT repeat protein/tRNA A-37 threonylcarbamoyl transferase component Bud32
MRVCTRCRSLLSGAASTCPSDGAPAEEVERLPGGTLLGAYRIDRVLGEGGMGFVYEATHEVLHRRTAIKLLRPELASHPQVVTRFLQEAKAVNVIDHPNIINVYDYGDGADGSVYFVMELLEGETLDDLMRRKKPLPMPLLLHVFGQIAKALAAAHAKQIVHRDLKPANVYVVAREDNPCFIKLLDFGIAQLRGEGAVKGLTVAGSIMGTPQYMSPEQISGGAVDARSDVWALGVMLYRAATGVAPFKGEGFAELAGKILHDTPAPPRSLVAALPLAFDKLVASCLERDVVDRCQSVAEIVEGLERVKRELGLDDAAIAAVVRDTVDEATPDATGTTERTRGSLAGSVPQFQGVVGVPEAGPRSPARRPRGLVFALAGVAALGLGVLGVVVLGAKDAPPQAAAASASPPPPADPPARRSIVDAIAAGDRAGATQLARQVIDDALSSDSLQHQGFAVDALGLVARPEHAAVLYAALRRSPELRIKAARALGELELPDAAPKVRAALGESGDKIKVELAAVLVRLGDPDAVAILRRALTDPGLRLVAALALADHGEVKAARPILDELFAATPAGREPWRRAAGGLAKLGDAKARGALERELAQPDATRAVAAAELLAGLGDAKARAYLSRVVADSEFARRGEAALALARMGDAAGAAWIATGLASQDPGERKLAIATVARLRDPGHDRELARLATDDSDLAVRLVAAAALL